jgi:LPXTG-motif cell wall-anchored protein
VSPPASQQGLPNTGAPSGLLGLTTAALASIVLGAGLVRRGRRSAASG